MNTQPAHTTFARPQPFHPERATTFRAWINNREIEGCTALAEALTFEEAVAAVEHWANHKDSLSVLRDDAGKRSKLLQVYAIKRESKNTWRRDPMTGLSEPYRKQYAALVYTMAVDAFEPTRPFDAFRDNAVGRDLSLVEG